MEQRARIPVGPPVTNPIPSYWHSPTSPLSSLIDQKSEDSAEPYDYAIIGSGLSGAMIAYNLLYPASNKSPIPRIVMLEAREVCGGATGRNGGHTKAASYRTYLQHKEKYGKDEALRIARLEYANIVQTHKLAKELGIECDNQRCNTVDLIYDHNTFQVGKKAIQQIMEDANEAEKELGGMAWYRVYEKSDGIMQKFWAGGNNTNPEVKVGDGEDKDEELVGAFEYAAGRINAYKLTTGILKKCVEKGLLLNTNTPVHCVLPSSSLPGGGEQIYEVFNQYNSIHARTIIFATNGYTPYLLKSLQGKIVPLRGQITAQRPPKLAAHPSVLPWTYSFIYRSGYEYMISRNEPDGTQHIIIGGGVSRLQEGGASEFGTVDDSRLNLSVSSYLHGTLSGYFGASNDNAPTEGDSKYEIVQEWTGIMGATADGLPFVGEVPGSQGMWVSAGFNGHGMVLCLKSAEALVKMVTEQHTEIEWFPQSFLISEERLARCVFKGRTDIHVPETGAPSVTQGVKSR